MDRRATPMKAKKHPMKTDQMVLGVLDISETMSDSLVADKYRDLTISWSRYDYRGELIEDTSVNAILDRAGMLGYRWCLILPYGHVIAERWRPEHWRGPDFASALRDRMDRDDFLVAGSIRADDDAWFGFQNQCVLVNLDMYQQLGAPSFDSVCERPIELPKAEQRIEAGRIAALVPSGESESRQPTMTGWHFIATSLRGGVPVVGFDEPLSEGILDLSATCPARAQAMANYFHAGIVNYDPEETHADLGQDQVAFLNMVRPQTTGARNGVFLWNIEAYADIETPREDFLSPIGSLYSVAAGFKPNRILQTHGWDQSTRVVFFDYSPRALEIRRYLVENWDGEDFPKFVERLFAAFPHPETFYQLWDGRTPEDVDSSDIERVWQRELAHWGTAEAFRDHWQSYVELPHEYVDCNLMTDPTPLLDQIVNEPSAIIWWSNAFFTVYGNWFYSLEQRKQVYDNWIQQIAERNPDLYLFGSDYNNVNVNAIRAGEYWDAYQRAGSDWLNPSRLSKTEMRM